MSRTILGATAAALILGVSAVAIAQSGGDVRSTDRKIEKALDHDKLTPIRPIRRVGPEDWPAGDPNARADNVNKPKETTGQAAADSKSDAKQEQTKQPAAEPPKQDQAKQEPSKQQDQQPANQNAAQQQPVPANQQAQQAQPANQQAQQAGPGNQPQQQNAQPQQANAPQQQKRDNFASVRLGTDANGRVAINDAQEKQIFSALRRQRLRPADASVRVGAQAPPDVRLGAVSADIVSVLPQFRGYSFFATRDELVIVEPTDKKVVALVPLNSSQIAARPERERSSERTKERGEGNAERTTERAERSSSRSFGGSTNRRETTRETVGAAIPTEQEILNAPVTGSSSRAQTRIEPDEDTVVIERRPHRHRVFGIFRF